MAKKAAKKAAAPKKELTKTEILTSLAGSTGLSKAQVSSVLDELGSLIQANIGKRGAPGAFTLPGLMKIEKKVKPATKKRKGINPRTGEEIEIAAKPKTNVVKIRPLKALKEMV